MENTGSNELHTNDFLCCSTAAVGPHPSSWARVTGSHALVGAGLAPAVRLRAHYKPPSTELGCRLVNRVVELSGITQEKGCRFPPLPRLTEPAFDRSSIERSFGSHSRPRFCFPLVLNGLTASVPGDRCQYSIRDQGGDTVPSNLPKREGSVGVTGMGLWAHVGLFFDCLE